MNSSKIIKERYKRVLNVRSMADMTAKVREVLDKASDETQV
jgi:hypothetical protein